MGTGFQGAMLRALGATGLPRLVKTRSAMASCPLAEGGQEPPK